MKKKILIYSDCFIYSGSENVIENILSSKKIAKKFDVSFRYVANREYISRFWQRIGGSTLHGVVRPIHILSRGYFINFFRNKSNNTFDRYKNLLVASSIYLLEFILVGHIYNGIKLFLMIRSDKPTVFYVNNGGYPGANSCRIAVIAATLAGVRSIVFNVNNMAYPKRGIFDGFLDFLVKRFVTVFITASYAAQERLIDLRNFPRTKFVRVPNTLLPSAKLSENDIVSENHGEKLTIMSIGLLTERKGFIVLIRAANELVRRGHTNFSIYILGDGEERDRLIMEVKSLCLQDFVHFLGYKDRPQDYLKKSDLFVLPSISNEDFPYVILEAMRLSKPVIGTNVAGIPEQVVNGVNGYVIDPGNEVQLSNSIEKFLLQPQKIRSMGESSYSRYMEHFVFSKIESQYMEIFNVLAAHKL